MLPEDWGVQGVPRIYWTRGGGDMIALGFSRCEDGWLGSPENEGLQAARENRSRHLL